MAATDLTVRILAQTQGLMNGLRQARDGITGLERSTARTTSSLSQLAIVGAGAFGGLGIAKVIKDSVTLEAAYSKTMAQVAVATNAPKDQLKSLDDLALQLGADTVFSAQDAASAMLELAKGGLSTAQIKAGALSDTLTLAAAGGLELGDAAGTVVNAMGAFQLKASQTGAAVAALAGAANASSSDVSDITQALAQAGTSAHSAGLSIQETTAYLALFSNQGIKGSDAGTSLRTMLTRLVPQTNQAKAAMDRLHLSYVDGNGQLVNATEIAARTQKAFKGLSDQERIRDTNAIFGQDAQRAVNAITAEGADGLRKYLKSTNDLTQAQKLAKAANSGTAGSIENLKGSIETAEIKIGKGLAPAIQKLAAEAEDFVQKGDLEKWSREGGDALLDFAHEIAPLVQSLGGLAQSALPAVKSAGEATIEVLETAAHIITPLVDGFNKLPDSAQKALILAAGAQTLSRRLAPVPGLANSAGGGLLAFGGNARRAARDAEESSTRLGTLGGSLKSFAAISAGIAAASYVIPKGADQVNTIVKGFKEAKDQSTDFAKTFDQNGKSTAATLALLKTRLDESNAKGKAKEFGVDLDQLAKSLKAGGTQGDYFSKTMEKLDKARPDSLLGRLKQQFSSFHPTNLGDLSALTHALKDIGDEYDKAATSSTITGRAFNQTRNELMLAGAGIDKYRDQLRVLPTAVVTAITTPGALKSREDVVSLARQFNLTPKQVETIMRAKDFATKDIKAVIKYLREHDGDTSTVKVDAKDNASPKIRNVRQLMEDIDGDVARTYIDTIRRSYTDKGDKVNGSLQDMLRPYTGMRLPPGYARGGKVPGRPPANPKVDNVFARGANSNKMLMVRSGEWIVNEQQSKKNDRWLRAINGGLDMDSLLPGYASGRPGTYGSNIAWAQHASDANLKWAITTWQKALEKNTDKLSSLKDEMKSYSATVRDSFRTDPFNRDAESPGGGGINGLAYSLVSDTSNANAMSAALKTLKAKKVNEGLYKAIAASGDLATAQQLAALSPSGIDQYDKLYLARNKATTALGTQAGDAVYGKQVAEQTAAINGMRHDIHEFKKELRAGTKAGIRDGLADAAKSGQNRATNSVRR